ncbi:MAG: hypothetical protein QF440_05000 [Candidatus Thalassarchaeaceae archaeon]|jgi:hypothetical protein|nr:hypothetical protein [Candidatus Thalassarchaeaceae archaeon]
MSDADIGSVIFDESETLVVPKPKVRPNAAIPITSAIILFLGALISGYSGVTGLLSDGYDDDYIHQLYEQFNGTTDENLTQDDIRMYVEEIENSSYSKISSYVDIIVAVLLVIGGVLLFRGNRKGVQYGTSGAGIMTVSYIWSGFTSHQASSHLPKVVALTFTTVSFVMIFCGLFCLGAAFLPLMFASGRAALSHKTLMETMSFEEE